MSDRAVFPISAERAIRFGPFELRRVSAMLFKSGIRVRLHPQPFGVLALLASRPGEIVTRQEIRDLVWGSNTFVDFDEAINFCLRQIRSVLQDNPKTPLYVETVRGRGYRFIAPVDPVEGSTIPNLALSALLTSCEAQNLGAITVAVLPFCDMSGPSENQQFADVLTEVVITNLSQLNGLRVTPRTSIMRYKGVSKPLREIIDELDANVIVEGAVTCRKRHVRITARLIDGLTERNLWATTYERDGGNLFALQSEIGWAVTKEISQRLCPLAARNDVAVLRAEARQAYVTGRFYWSTRTEGGLRKAIEYFERAITLDARDPLPYTGIADCHVILSQNGAIDPNTAYPKAKRAAAVALGLDPASSEAHTSWAYTKMICDWDWEAAETGFRKAILLNPGYAQAHQWYADYLTAVKRHRDAIAEMRRAWELDPLSQIIRADVGWTLSYAGLCDQAIQHYRRIVQLDPSFLQARWGLGLSYLQKSMPEEAISELEQAVALSGASPVMLAALGGAYATSGRTSKARRLLERLEQLSRRRYVPSYERATLCFCLGDKDRAFEWLRKAYSERSGYLVYLGADPRLHIARSDPRLRALANLVGLTC